MRQDDRSEKGTERSSAEIRESIERKRSEMDTTVDAIESKLTPRQLIQEAWGMFRGGSSDEPGIATRVIKEHPLPAAVAGIGLGWLAVESMSGSSEEKRHRESQGRQARGRRSRPGARAGYPGRYEPYGSVEGRYSEQEGEEEGGMMENVKEKAHDAKEWASHAKDRVVESTSHAKERISGVTEQAGEGMSHLGEEVRERTEQMGNTLQRRTRQARRGLSHAMDETPLTVGMAAFTAGLVGGLSFPTSRWEDETMGETRDTLMHEAKEAGEETLQEAKHVAVAAAEGAVHKAKEEDLTPGRMAESVREVAREAKESAKAEAEKEGLTPEGMKERMQGGSEKGKGQRETPSGRGEGGGGEGSRGGSSGGEGGPGGGRGRSGRQGGKPPSSR